MKKLLFGNKFLQRFWWIIYKIAIKGLNYDRGHVPDVNGEVFCAKYVLKNINKKNIIVFDVGANRGQYLSMFLKQLDLNKQVAVHCFEPQKDAFQTLCKISNGKPFVQLINKGIGSAVGEMKLYKDSEESEYASLYKSNYIQYNTILNNEEIVKIDTLDNYCIENNIFYIDFLKIDVEGHELEVLKGAQTLLNTGKIHFIQFEFGLAAIESRIFMKDFVDILKNYRIYRILPNGLAQIHYTEYHELFLTTNYLAIKK